MDTKLPKKPIVKVVLSKEQREILDKIAAKLGQSESETMRMAFMEYAKEINVVTEKVHEKTWNCQVSLISGMAYQL